MSNFPKDSYLSGEIKFVSTVDYHVLWKDFNWYFLSGRYVNTFPHWSESPLTDDFSNKVIADLLILLLW